MVSMTDLSAYHGTDASDARLKKRHAAELRLKIYGILAITLAGAALIALLWSVVGKASGALTEHYITLPLENLAEEIDPEGTGDPKVIGKANFSGYTKDILKAAFPTVTDRRAKRELYDIVSSGSGFELREQLIADPEQVNDLESFDFLASDIADLYFKGRYGALDRVETNGSLTLEEDGKEVVITSTDPDFSEALEVVKAGLVKEVRRLRRQANLQDNGVKEFQRRAENATDETVRETSLGQVAQREAERDRMLAEAEELEARSAAEGGRELIGKREASLLLRVGDGWIKMSEVTATGGRGTVLSPVEMGEFAAGEWSYFAAQQPEVARKINDRQLVWLETLREQGAVKETFNMRFFSTGDSREPELAGLWGAIVGSFWTMLVTFVISFPIGVLTAIYLEEFAPKTRFTDLIEVNINNLAAVPSIIFGLLGLSVFLSFFGMPRSAPLVGGLVLALMTLPTIIISSRAAIRAVPPSIRDAALGIGASKIQATFHHVLPLAMPGILTGTILGMAQALGETAPLIMIGMVAFIVDIPGGITESASVLPVQVFRWADFPERAFESRTALAICVLLVFLVVMNLVAVILRKRFERRW